MNRSKQLSKPAAKRPKGDGWYETLPSGRIRKKITINGRTITGPAMPTRTEAAAELARVLQERKSIESPSSKFSTYAKSWLATKRTLSPTTKDIYGYWIEQLAESDLGNLPLAKVTKNALAEWVETSGVKPVTAKKRVGFYRQILRHAGINVDAPRIKVDDHPRRPLSPDETAILRKVLDECPPMVKLGAYLCLGVGLRRSEACGLKHEDRDGAGCRIDRAAVVTRDAFIVKPMPKNGRSRRWVALPAFLRDQIGPPRKGYVLGSETRPMHPKTLSSNLSKHIESTILEKIPYMGLHALRRTCGMLLLEAGVDVRTASEQLGHDPAMLINEYTRSRTDLKASAIDRTFAGWHNDHDGDQQPESEPAAIIFES